MKQKKLYIIAFSLIFLYLITIVNAAPIVSVSGFDTDGSIDTRMNHFTLNLDLVNNGDSCARAVTVSTSSIFITNKDSDNGPTDVCTDETFELKFDIPPNTPAGTYPVSITGSYTDINSSRQYTFSDILNIYINGNSDINAHIISSNPINAYPGDTVTMSVIIENDGTLQVQSLNGQLSADLPIEVKPAESFFSIGSLPPKQSYIATFSFDIPKDAQAQSYPMTLNLAYTEKNTDQTKVIPLTFSVKKKAMFSATNTGSDIFYPNDFGKILKIKVTNTGTDIAKEVKVQIEPQYPFSTDGSIRYITNLNPGDSSIVEFSMDVDKSATIGSYGTDVILNFQDPQGNNLNDDVVTMINVQKKSLTQVLFGDYWYVWLIEMVIILIILIRLSRRKPKETKKGNGQEIK